MKASVEMPSPAWRVLLRELDRRILTMQAHKYATSERHGKGHTLTVAAGRDIELMKSALKALTDAFNEAASKPQDITQSAAGMTALQVGDEMPLVYGKPRNDPRNPKRKVK